MKTTNLFRVAAALVLTIAGALSASAAGALAVSRTAMSSDANHNYQHFEVQATTDGTHYAEFWLCPAHSANGGYTEYVVYVNGGFAGTITPDKSGWQAIKLDENASFNLKKGTNIISVATDASRIPDVEAISVSDEMDKARIDHTAYDEYLANARLGIATEPDIAVDMPMQMAATAPGMIMKTSLTLRYTASKLIKFNKDDIASVTVIGDVKHVVDAIFAGSTPIPVQGDGPMESRTNYMEPTLKDYAYLDTTKLILMTHATSEEMQEYNWHKESQLKRGNEQTTLKFNVPVTGYYLVRVSTTANDVVGTADIDVADGDYYEPEPISCTKFDCVIPADGTEYLSFTNCYDQENDDPVIYVHGQNGNIVGFRDDCQGRWQDKYDLCGHDATIVQSYKQATTAISVSSYRTDNPVSKCTVVARVPLANTYSSPSRTSDEDKSVEFPKAVTMGSNIEIMSDDVIKHVSAHNVYGTPVGRVDADDTQLDIPTSSLNLNKTGLYILTVETVSGVESARILVK